MFDSAVVFLDLETTGASADRDRITEVGLIEVIDGEYVDEWSTLVNPASAPTAICHSEVEYRSESSAT